MPKLIDDKQIRTQQVREFLGNDYPTDQLPDVEETRQLVREHRQQSEAFEQSQRQAEQLEQLTRRQQERQQQLQQEKNEWLKQQTQQRNCLLDDQRTNREKIKQQYQDQQTNIQQQRDAKKRTGLSATLAKFTGLNFLQQHFHKYQDNQAEKQYEQQRQQLLQDQQQQRESFEQQRQTQQLDFDRKERALQLIEQRELNSLQTQTTKENRLQYRKSVEHMPAVNLQLKPPGRYPMVHRAKHRFTSDQQTPEQSALKQQAIKQPEPSQTDERAHTTEPTENNKQVHQREIDTNQDCSSDQSLTRQYNEPHQDNSRKR